MRRLVALGLVAIVAVLVASAVLRTPARSTGGASDSAPPREVVDAGRTSKAHRPGATHDAAAIGDAASPSVVHGTVKDKNGAPVGGADVEALDGMPSGHERVLATTTTAADGTYDLSVPDDGASVVLATKDGFAPQAGYLATGKVDLVLQPGMPRDLLVVDPNGRPVAGAGVTLQGGSGSIDVAHTTTDDRGRAHVVAEDKASVVVRAHGFAYESDAVVGPDDVDGIHRIELHEGRKISGVVVDADGAPLAGVDVALRGWGVCTNYFADDDHRTGPDGAFEFEGIGADPSETPWRLDFADAKWTASPVFATPGRADVRLVAYRAAVVRGVVTYPDGKVPSHASVTWDASAHETFIDGDGWFEALGVLPGRHTITAVAFSPEGMNVGWRGSAVVDVPEGGTVEDVRITVAPDPSTSFVFARVIDATGAPQPFADVTAWHDGIALGRSYQFDPRGLLFVAVPPGTPVVVTAHCYTETVHGCARTETPVLTSATPPKEPFDLRLGPMGTLCLRLVDPEGHEIPTDRATIQTEAAANPDGTYVLAADATFGATIRVPGLADKSVGFAPPQPLHREETVQLAPATRVAGRFVRAGGTPASGTATVTLVADERETDTADASPGDDGRFVVDSLPAGYARLVAKNGEDVVVYREFDLVAGAPADLGDVVVPERATLRLRVVDESGRPLGGAEATLVDPSGGSVTGATSSRPDGTFEFRAAIGLPSRVLVRRSGFATRLVEPVAPGAEPQSIVLGAAGSVRVRAAAVADAGDLRVEAAAAGAPSWRWSPTQADGTASGDLRGADGAVYVDLPPGAVEISLVTPRRRLVRTVDVVAGKTVDCAFGE
jgi:hypothetical protein